MHDRRNAGARRGRARRAALTGALALMGLTLTASAAFGGFDGLAKAVRDHVYCKVGNCDFTGPKTRIRGPHKTRNNDPVFRLRANERRARFQYRLDRRGGFHRTGARVKLRNVKRGRHLLEARAIDRAGNKGDVDRFKFRVLAKRRHRHRGHH